MLCPLQLFLRRLPISGDRVRVLSPGPQVSSTEKRLHIKVLGNYVDREQQDSSTAAPGVIVSLYFQILLRKIQIRKNLPISFQTN